MSKEHLPSPPAEVQPFFAEAPSRQVGLPAWFPEGSAAGAEAPASVPEALALYFGFRVKSSLNKNFMKTITSLTFLAFTFCAAFLDSDGAQPLTVTTIAGQYGKGNFLNGIGTNATFSQTGPMAADPTGNLYLIDNSSIQKISPDHTVTTFAGSPFQSGYLDATGTNKFYQLSQ